MGNPPFVGGKDMRAELGDGYAEAVWKARPEVPGGADFVMQWWDEAARRLARRGAAKAPNPLRRFGFITTSSLTQTFSRRVVERHLKGREPLSLAFAVPDHPWVNGAGKAAVRIAMTVMRRGAREGTLARVVAEEGLNTDAPAVALDKAKGTITAKLTLGADTMAAVPLLANEGLGNFGMALHGQAFVLNLDRRRQFSASARVKPYLKGKDLLRRPEDRRVLDLSGMSRAELEQTEPEVYAYLLDYLKPERDHNKRKSIREGWWLYGWDRPVLRSALRGTDRFIGTTETAKHRVFQFIAAETIPDHMIVAVALDRADALAILSSRLHVAWSLGVGGTLEDRPRYSKTRTFDPFPFSALLTDPEPDAAGRASLERLRELGERLDALRVERLDAHRDLTMTSLYNRLERRREALAGGEPLSDDERADHERARTPLLAELHDAIDRAALAAYGWDDLAPALVGRPGGTVPSQAKSAAQEAAEEELLGRLVALNRERAEEEARGHVRWLRPDYQKPRLGHRVPEPTEQAAMDVAVAALPEALPWPAEPRAQFGAVRAILDAAPEPLPPEAVARSFRGRLSPQRRARVEEVLSIMADLGIARAGERAGAKLFQARR